MCKHKTKKSIAYATKTKKEIKVTVKVNKNNDKVNIKNKLTK